MKVTNFTPGSLPLALGGWSTGVFSLNSNATTTDGGLSAINFVQRITANGSNVLLNPSVNFAAGSNITLSASSNTILIADIGGSGLDAELNIEGGQDVTNHLGSVSGAVSLDPTLGNVFDMTMTGDVTLTIETPVGSGQSDLYGWVTQDGTGGHVLTIVSAGSVVDSTTPDTTAGVTERYILSRLPGTTDDWIVSLVGGSGGSPATTVTDETAFGLSPDVGTDTEYARQDHGHGTPSADAVQLLGHYELLMAAGSSPIEPLETGDGLDWLYVWVT